MLESLLDSRIRRLYRLEGGKIPQRGQRGNRQVKSALGAFAVGESQREKLCGFRGYENRKFLCLVQTADIAGCLCPVKKRVIFLAESKAFLKQRVVSPIIQGDRDDRI